MRGEGGEREGEREKMLTPHLVLPGKKREIREEELIGIRDSPLGKKK